MLDYSRYVETKHKTRFGLHPCGNVHRRLVNRNVWPKRSRSDPSPVVQTDNYHQTQMFAGKSERVHTRPFGHDYRLRVNRTAPPVCATVTICIDGAAIPSQIVHGLVTFDSDQGPTFRRKIRTTSRDSRLDENWNRITRITLMKRKYRNSIPHDATRRDGPSKAHVRSYGRPTNNRTIGGGRGRTVRFTLEPRATATPERFRLSIALVLKHPVCRFVGLSALALVPFHPTKPSLFFLFPPRWRTQRDATRLSHRRIVVPPAPPDAILDPFDRLGDSRFPILGYSFVNTCSYTLYS